MNIMESLRDVERDCGVRILYACESGSRAWGFESNDSDYDVRFIYHHPVDRYLSVNLPAQHLRRSVESEYPIDMVGWDLFKTCRLLGKNNPSLGEWLRSPIQYTVNDGSVGVDMFHLSNIFFSPKASAHHYISMCSSNWIDHVGGNEQPSMKRYLYCMRPAMCARYVIKANKFPPVNFELLMKCSDVADGVKDELVELIKKKSGQGESETCRRVKSFNDYIEETISVFREMANSLPAVKTPARELDSIIKKALDR